LTKSLLLFGCPLSAAASRPRALRQNRPRLQPHLSSLPTQFRFLKWPRAVDLVLMTNSNKIGMVVGALLAGWHLLWSVLVLIGFAQPIIDFIFWAHMIKPVYVVKPFDPVAAVTLIMITGVIGYAFGFVGAIIWNRLHG